MASKAYDAGVKEYRDMYWTPDYVPLDTDLLACFKCTGQPGVPKEEVAAAVAAESSTGPGVPFGQNCLLISSFTKAARIVSKTCLATMSRSMHSSRIQSICSKKALSSTY